MAKKIVFVIGAGASKEVNLPTGYKLKEKIAQLLNLKWQYGYDQQISGDKLIAAALREIVRDQKCQDINPYVHEAKKISNALPLAISIDNFIDAHRDNEKLAVCGKLAIVRSILQAERSSSLFFKDDRSDSTIDLGKLNDTWYLAFFQLLTENCTISELKERLEHIALIVFNYDRCIEHFLFHALKKYYSISDTDSADIVSSLAIYHPYGSVGSLRWFNSKSEQVPVMDFGGQPDATGLLQLSKSIKTFTEGSDPNSSEILSIRKCMGEADQLVYLGFAFHKLNMQLIAPYENGSVPFFDKQKKHDAAAIGITIASPQCFATAYGISQSDQKVIRQKINEQYSQEIDTELADLSCASFFKEFWRSPSF